MAATALFIGSTARSRRRVDASGHVVGCEHRVIAFRGWRSTRPCLGDRDSNKARDAGGVWALEWRRGSRRGVPEGIFSGIRQ